MNTMNKLAALLLLSACTVGCADGSKSVGSGDQASSATDRSTDTSKTLPSGPTKSTTPVTPDEVIDFRGGERSINATDYSATDGTYRLYGVDGSNEGPTATIAELGTWITRQYKVGDSFGRGLVISKIDDTGVTLHGAHSDVRMNVATDTDLRVIRHDLDVVAQPLGKHRFNLSTPAARAARDTNPARPSVETVDLYDQKLQKLGAIPAGGLWAAADFREGDLVVGDSESALVQIETALTDGRANVDVTVYRGGVPFARRYEVIR